MIENVMADKVASVYIPEKSRHRRIKRVKISFDLLIDMVQAGWISNGQLECIEGVPPDAVFVGSFTDIMSGCGYLEFYHSSFEHVPDGSYPETINVLIKEHMYLPDRGDGT